MSPIEVLHTFARRYCMEREAELRHESARAREQGTNKTDEHNPPRRQVVEAILVEVERLTPADFRSRHHTAFRLIETGQMAQDFHTRQKMWQKPPYQQAMQEERDCFAEAVRQFVAQGDWKRWRVEPLPYRRTLREDESAGLMARLRERWGITKKWWEPFDHYELPYEITVLHSTAVRDELKLETLRTILAKHGVGLIYELPEYESMPDRELDLSLWNPYQGLGSEKYALTNQMDWLFYTTHEDSTTIAGDWLLQEIKAAWPDWSDHQWAAPWWQKEQS